MLEQVIHHLFVIKATVFVMRPLSEGVPHMRLAAIFLVIQDLPMLFASIRPGQITKLGEFIDRLRSNQVEAILTSTKVKTDVGRQ
ncbi:hypothetical protein D3C76_1656650 [compost metagenome]